MLWRDCRQLLPMPKPKSKSLDLFANEPPPLAWQKASYSFHSYAYRDPRTVFAAGSGSPVVSPTTVLLGLVATLFAFGRTEDAKALLPILHQCEVLVDAPDGIIFFRAFHQLRRYEHWYIGKEKSKGPEPRVGLTKINQGTKEYGLVEGVTTLYVATPNEHIEAISFALENLRHLGSHDSLCSLEGPVERCQKPLNVIYATGENFGEQISSGQFSLGELNVTRVTLSRLTSGLIWQNGKINWFLAGGSETEQVSYVIPGSLRGTTRGKIYRKSRNSTA